MVFGRTGRRATRGGPGQGANRTRVLLLTAALTGAVSLAAVPGLSNASTPSDELVSWEQGAYPVVPLAELAATGRETAVLAAELAENNPDGVLGSFVDDNKKVVVSLTRDALADSGTLSLVRRLNVELRYSRYGANEVTGLGDALRERSASLESLIVTWGPQPQIGGLFISLTGAPNEADRQIISDFANEQSLPIRVEVTPGETAGGADDGRLTDPSPFAGGARYYSADGSGSGADLKGRCSYGFPYLEGGRHYMLTAGHCHPRNRNDLDFAWIGRGSNTGPVSKEQYSGRVCCSTYVNGTGTVQAGQDNANHGDLAAIDLSGGKTSGESIFWGPVQTTSKIPLTGRVAPAVGDDACINGSSSGSDCGIRINAVNVSHTYGDGDVIRNVDRAGSFEDADCSQGGDSGGSVVRDHAGAETYATAIGIVSGHSSQGVGCYQWFTGVEEAMQAWGGNLNFR